MGLQLKDLKQPSFFCTSNVQFEYSEHISFLKGLTGLFLLGTPLVMVFMTNLKDVALESSVQTALLLRRQVDKIEPDRFLGSNNSYAEYVLLSMRM